ncbi:MAG: glycosyltransferase family 4 protein [Chloroflexota bacterium]
MHDVLLTVSGTIPTDIESQIAEEKRPLADYIAMARTFGADLIDYPIARRQTGWLGGIIEKLAGRNAMLAWACYQKRGQYRVLFTDGEQVGIPLALLLKFASFGKRPLHFAIGHILSVGKKMLFFDYLKIQSHIDRFFVYATWQKRFIEERWQVPGERVVFTPFMVDADFFSPERAGGAMDKLRTLAPAGVPVICAVGLEFRDYPTLMEAVAGLDVHVVIAAGSPWSKRSDTTEGQEIPDNVTVQRFSQYELRDLYAMSEFLVMPLFNVNFQAGVTALLEAMAMSKAVICSSTPGQTDVVVEGETGLYVPPENAKALREAIQTLLQQPERSAEMGRNGRIRIEQEMSLARYTERLNAYVNPEPLKTV